MVFRSAGELTSCGTGMANVINWLALRQLGLLAWPNIWAQSEVVPELVGSPAASCGKTGSTTIKSYNRCAIACVSG